MFVKLKFIWGENIKSLEYKIDNIFTDWDKFDEEINRVMWLRVPGLNSEE